MTIFSLTDCCHVLAIDPKTLHRWLRLSQMSLQPHPSDARMKCVTLPLSVLQGALEGREVAR